MSSIKIKKFELNSNNLIKNIIREIIRELDSREVKLEKQFVEFVVDLMSLDPANLLDLSKSMINRDVIEAFIQKCLDRLTDSKSPSLISLKMQAYFFENFITKDEIISNYLKQLMNKTTLITKEITEAEILTREDQDSLIKKIILDIITKSSLGNPSSAEVVAETSNALHSVMSRQDIENFISLNKDDRLSSLIEIREIVTGIILFNQDAGNSSLPIMDLPQILDQSHESTKSILQITLCEIMDRVNLLSSAIYAAVSHDLKNRQIIVLLPENVGPPDYERVKDLLVMNRQHEIFTRKLIDFLSEVKQDIDKATARYHEMLKIIHDTVQFRTAIPTEKVFPKFAELAKSWNWMSSEIFLLSEINQINNQLLQLAEKAPSCDEIAYKMLGDGLIETDEDRAAKVREREMIFLGDFCVVQPYSKRMRLEYFGFCTWMLAQGRGILIPGVPDIGICCYRGANFTFSSPEVAAIFEDNPERFRMKVIEVARTKIELIRLLDIYEQVKSVGYQVSYVSGASSESGAEMVDAEMQTELHPIPAYKDEKYFWNVWDLRRKAIELANLRKCSTKSAQTMLSYQKYNVQIQAEVLPMKERGSQTRRESCTATMEKRRQQFGMRKTVSEGGMKQAEDLSSCLEVMKL